MISLWKVSLSNDFLVLIVFARCQTCRHHTLRDWRFARHWRQYGKKEIKVEVLLKEVGNSNDKESNASDTNSGGIQFNLTIFVSKGGPFLDFTFTGYADEVYDRGHRRQAKATNKIRHSWSNLYDGPPFKWVSWCIIPCMYFIILVFWGFKGTLMSRILYLCGY